MDEKIYMIQPRYLELIRNGGFKNNIHPKRIFIVSKNYKI